ncbi:hypothetical protein B296_00002971 [Ensete ventricosum]|uniref:Uncharacterized protein n=1 Tax=Ensete ventricosum TaxID=4639 RepID=A0A427BB41_ENSVE|nr:hypothetical protein B296_00002971 [Ensete ventricosum]
MFNGFDAFGCIRVRPYTERRLRRFPGFGSVGSAYDIQSNQRDLRSSMLELPRVEVVSSSLGGATPTDSKILKVLMVMQSCCNSDSTMMVCWLAKVRERLCILVEYERHVSGAPSNNKGWKVRFFFISHSRGWGFRPKWTARSVSHVAPNLLDEESELVGILWGILSSSRAIKDMTEARLVEVGLSLARRDMFNLMKVKKSMGHATGRPAPSPPPEVPVEVPGECFSHGEERPDGGWSELPKKKIKVAVSKRLKKVRGTSKKDHRDKGKEPTEVT